MKEKVYLDNNSTTPLDPLITQFLAQQLQVFLGNPSSVHSFGQTARAALIKARDTIANFLQVKPQEIIFNSGATEGANTFIRSLMASHPNCHIITSEAEHPCVHSTIKDLIKHGHQASFLLPGPYGAVSPQAIENAIQSNTRLIAIMAANNETGVKSDIEAISNVAQKHHIPLFVDGVALLGKENFTIPPGVSAMCFSGHKIHALPGSGFLFLRKNLKLQPFLSGGSQEFNQRAGTENLIGILSLSKAIELLDLPSSTSHMLELRNLFESTLQKFLHIQINGLGPRLPNTSNITFPNTDGETLLFKLDQLGIAASLGSACSSGALQPSRILLSMGLPIHQTQSSLRFSFSRLNTKNEILHAANTIISLLR